MHLTALMKETYFTTAWSLYSFISNICFWKACDIFSTTYNTQILPKLLGKILTGETNLNSLTRLTVSIMRFKYRTENGKWLNILPWIFSSFNFFLFVYVRRTQLRRSVHLSKKTKYQKKSSNHEKYLYENDINLCLQKIIKK